MSHISAIPFHHAAITGALSINSKFIRSWAKSTFVCIFLSNLGYKSMTGHVFVLRPARRVPRRALARGGRWCAYTKQESDTTEIDNRSVPHPPPPKPPPPPILSRPAGPRGRSEMCFITYKKELLRAMHVQNVGHRAAVHSGQYVVPVAFCRLALFVKGGAVGQRTLLSVYYSHSLSYSAY